MPITIVISAFNAFENEMVGRAFKRRLEKFKIVASAVTRDDLIKQVAGRHPDVALVSIDPANEPAARFQALRQLSQISPSTRAVAVLNHSNPVDVVEAFAQGARGVFCKNEGFDALCRCIQSVHSGQIWADSDQLQWVFHALTQRGAAHVVSATGVPLLTKREEQIVRMATDGLPNSEISQALGLKPHTVKNYLFRIYEKLGVSSRVELILYVLSKHDPLAGGGDLSKHSAA